MARALEIYKRIQKVCLKCGKEFKVFPYQNNSKYCSRKCGAGNSLKGKHQNEEAKLRISKANKGRKYTQEVREKISQIKKEQFKNGLKPWNTGLPTKSNNALEEYRLKNGGNYGKKHPNWKGGLNPMWVRKQRLAINGGSHTLAEWETLKAQYNWICPGCRLKKELTKDHIIPISKGGSDNIENIQPLCRSCNSQKHKQEVKFEY